jgi:hypothetical protein
MGPVITRKQAQQRREKQAWRGLVPIWIWPGTAHAWSSALCVARQSSEFRLAGCAVRLLAWYSVETCEVWMYEWGLPIGRDGD